MHSVGVTDNAGAFEFADAPLVKPSRDSVGDRIKPCPHGLGDIQPFFLRERKKLRALCGGHRHWLFAQNIFPVLQGEAGVFIVTVMSCDDIDSIHAL